jgi:uncharacterized protein (TIGR03086 family)
VRQLVNHVTRANLSYVRLLTGGTGAEFLALREVDALGDDPVDAFARSVHECATAFTAPAASAATLDHPLNRMSADQALAVRTADTTIHTWDLARAIGAPDRLDEDLVAWISRNMNEIFAGLPEMPTSEQTTHRFFAAPSGPRPEGSSAQNRLLYLMGRQPGG